MKNIITFICTISIILLIQNCEEAPTGPIEVSAEDTAAASAYVDEGNEAFFSFMMNGPDEGECPEFDENGSASNLVQGCLDMSDIDGKYDKALEKDPNHKGAIFGKAYMELFLISQDELLKTTIDDWENCFKHYIDEFEDDDLDRSIINSNEFEMGFPNSGNAFFSNAFSKCILRMHSGQTRFQNSF